jgi:lysosomal acid lipase/cholesteryl ester hydrolase
VNLPIDRIYSIPTSDGIRQTVLHRLTTEDGVGVSVSHLARARASDSVLLIHGLTTSSDMYVMPEHYNLAAYLYDQGYDVWAADFRMSNHYVNNQRRRFTFDDVALYDWPLIVKHVRGHMPGKRLHVIAHCLGSATFHLALYGKTVAADLVDSVIANSISLNPRVRWWSAVKLLLAPFLVEKVLRLPYVDPRWSEFDNIERPWLGRLLARLAGLAHLECNQHACNVLSFMWGTGFPALFEHCNMHVATHDRLAELFGPVGMEYFRNVRKGVLSNQTLVKYARGDKYSRLPERYFDGVAEVAVPTLLVSGDKNHIFPGANKLTYERARQAGSRSFEYREFAGYGHQDVFMGKHCARDTFPVFCQFLSQQAQT